MAARGLVLPLGFAIAWLSVVFGLGLAEILIDPDSVDGVGEFLDALSFGLWIVGGGAVPVAAVLLSRSAQASWAAAASIAVLSLLTYAIGTVVAFYAYTLAYQLITGNPYYVR